MPLEDELQQQQPGALEQGNDGNVPGNDSSAAEGVQTEYQRITPEEAATLPYEELKQRMRQERDLYEQGLLPENANSGDSGEDDEFEEGDGGNSGSGASQREGSGDTPQGGNQQQSQGDPELQRLLKQAQDRAAQLETEKAQETVRLRQEQEQAELASQHRRVEEVISRLPQQQQELARQDYINRLRGQAVNDYYGFVQQREAQVRQAEIAQARVSIPNMLAELADSVAERHGLRNADPLKQYVTSKEFKQLLEASQTEDSLMAAAANAGQWMEFMAVQQATQNAQRKETRRAAGSRVTRDTPSGGVPVAGGDMDLVTRINKMTREEFFAWKKQQIKEANASS